MAPVKIVQLPPMSGIMCPACGRGMVPRILRTLNAENKRVVGCTFCGRTMHAVYSDDGRLPVKIQLI